MTVTLPVSVLKHVSIDITGQRFGSLVAIGPLRKSSRGKWIWLFSCDCGGHKEADKYSAARCGSCGCQTITKRVSSLSTHGESVLNTPEYRAWQNMIARCENHNGSHYSCYGGRGITVCQGWRNDYSAFLADMGRRPSPGHSIDRIDNNAGYSCGKCSECLSRNASMNCRWATKMEQSENRRKSTFAVINGQRKLVTEWCRILGIKFLTVYGRMQKGMSPEDAIAMPIANRYKKRRAYVVVNGKKTSVAQLAREHGMSAHVLRHRLSSGWGLSEAINTPVMSRKDIPLHRRRRTEGSGMIVEDIE